MFRYTSLVLVLLAVALGCVPALVPGVAAQESPQIELRANKGLQDFPSEIEFILEIAAPASPVETIELEYGVEKVSCQDSSVRAVPEVSRIGGEDGIVAASWTWDLRRSGSLPPGARVWWRWHVTTEDGGTWTSLEASLSFDDTSHDWQTVSQGQIAVHWYEGSADFGQEMLQTAVEAQARLTADPGANLERAVNIYFYASPDELRDALVFSQRWTGGIAFTDFYTILIAANPDELTYGRRTVAHELMHLVVHQLAFNCWGSLPRWLDEGLASWAEGDLEPQQQAALDRAIAGNELLSLRSLSGSFSAHADRANLSYAQSYSVVSHMIEEYGRERLLELLVIYREGATYDGALEDLYGFDTDGLEDRWRASVGAQPRPTGAAPSGEPTAVPTLALWSGEPTSPPGNTEGEPTPEPTPTVTPSLAPSPVAVATEAPPATEVALEPSPAASPESVFAPEPLGNAPEEAGSPGWTWLILGGGAVLLVVCLAVVLVIVRRH